MRTFLPRLAAIAIVAGLSVAGPVAPVGAFNRIDGIEHIFGSTNINAITGHGRLSAGVSADGDVTVLTWPNPSYADQLGYLSSNDIEARLLPRLGAPEAAGIVLGLVLEFDTDPRTVTWLRDRDSWSIDQSYGETDGPNIVTVYRSDAFGLDVTVRDAISPDGPDVLVREVRVERRNGSVVRGASLLTYANLSPVPAASRIPELPLTDWAFDGSNDYAALWDADAAAIVHFHPGNGIVYDQVTDILLKPRSTYGAVGTALGAGQVSVADASALLASVAADFPTGAVATLSTVPAPDQFQIGYDGPQLCTMRDVIADNVLALADELGDEVALPIDPSLLDILRCSDGPPIPVARGWQHAAEEAWADAADGDLDGSPAAAGEVDEALRTPLEFVDDVAVAAVVLGMGGTIAEAKAALASAADPASIVAAAEEALSAWLAERALPTGMSEEVQRVARRSLINLRVGTDAASGAVVASISRQPPYGLDWPRDGAFFNVALDISGQSPLVTRRARLYADWQRRQPIAATPLVDQAPPVDPRTGSATTYPAGAWEMNYYPDGMVGGLFRFEIDNTGFALWTMIAHAGWVAEEERVAYLADLWPRLHDAAELLAGWRDRENGLQAPASEDDNAPYTQTLHGAVTTQGALQLAARAALVLGEGAWARRWMGRACELRAVIDSRMYDAEAMRFVSRPDTSAPPDRAPIGQTAWMMWPFRVFSWDDPRLPEQIDNDLAFIGTPIRLENDGGAYFMKSTASIGLVEGSVADTRSVLLDYVQRIAEEHATTDTGIFGEAMVVRPDEDGVRAQQAVANPHLWEGILFYLSAMALDAPERFDLQESRLPEAPACEATLLCTGDCNGDGEVDVAELVLGVRRALGEIELGECVAFDRDFDTRVSVDEIIGGVGMALTSCGGN